MSNMTLTIDRTTYGMISAYTYTPVANKTVLQMADGSSVVKKLYDVSRIDANVFCGTQAKAKALISSSRKTSVSVTYQDTETGECTTADFRIESFTPPTCLHYPDLWGEAVIALVGIEALEE